MAHRLGFGAAATLVGLVLGCASAPVEGSETEESGPSEAGSGSDASSGTGAESGSDGTTSTSTGEGDGDGDGDCPPGNEGCPCFPNSTCFMPYVCEDWICVDPSGTDTGTTGENTDPCCEIHQSTGCEDEGVSACVCAEDDYCCEHDWDSICVHIAHQCGAMCDTGDASTADGAACIFNTECSSGFCYSPSSGADPTCHATCLNGGGGDTQPWCDDSTDCCAGGCSIGNGTCGN